MTGPLLRVRVRHGLPWRDALPPQVAYVVRLSVPSTDGRRHHEVVYVHPS